MRLQRRQRPRILTPSHPIRVTQLLRIAGPRPRPLRRATLSRHRHATLRSAAARHRHLMHHDPPGCWHQISTPSRPQPSPSAGEKRHSRILTIICHLLADPTAPYHDLGADYHARPDRHRTPRPRPRQATGSPRLHRHPGRRRVTRGIYANASPRFAIRACRTGRRAAQASLAYRGVAAPCPPYCSANAWRTSRGAAEP